MKTFSFTDAINLFKLYTGISNPLYQFHYIKHGLKSASTNK